VCLQKQSNLAKRIITHCCTSKIAKIRFFKTIAQVFTPDTWSQNEVRRPNIPFIGIKYSLNHQEKAHLGLFFLAELVLLAKKEILVDLYAWLPILLHQIFLGLDHNYNHCRSLLLNLLFFPSNPDLDLGK